MSVNPEFVGPGFPRPYELSTTSPCIDAGNNCMIACNDPEYALVDPDDPDTAGWTPQPGACGSEGNCERIPVDLAGRARVMVGGNLGEFVDMGAYEFPTCPACPADLNGDGYVGVADLLFLLAAWGPLRSGPDLDGDGIVGVSDLLILLAAWGECPECVESSGFGGDGGMQPNSGGDGSIQACIDAFLIDVDLQALFECVQAAGGDS